MKSTGDSREIEIKIAVSNAEDAADLLFGKGFAIVSPRVFEANDVFDTPAGALRAQGCVLRIRSAAQCILTFKGPAIHDRHKSREEFETAIADPSTAATILQHLGYAVSFRYEKYRTEFARPGDAGLVTLDETPIGNFLEIEGAAEWIDATARELGFAESDYLTASYGSLYRQYCAARGVLPSHMVFELAERPPQMGER